MGAQMPTEKYGVMSPFHAGGGGGGGTWAATQVFEGGSKTVPTPHSVALPTAGAIAVTTASDATAAMMMVVKR